MLKIILNRWKSQAEKIIAEEQAGFGAGRSTTEQIFNLRILCEKYLQHQQDLYHVVIVLYYVFQVTKNLYNEATTAVFFCSRIGDWFRATVGV